MANSGNKSNTQYLPAEYQKATSQILKKNVRGLKTNNLGYATILYG